jgi:hypothetical protein
MGRMNVFLYALVFLALLGVASASVNPNVQLMNYSISEVPLQPGHVVNLTLQLKSTEWDNCADALTVQIVTPYPLSTQGPDTQYLGKLCYQDPDEKGRVTFMIPVDPLAQVGTSQITVISTYEMYFAKYSTANTLNLRVGGFPSFQASVISSNPVDIYSGDSAMITIMLYNNGSDRAQSVQATLNAPAGIDAKWSTKTQELGTILSQGSATATFAVEAEKNTAPGNYDLDLAVRYASSSGQNSTYDFPFVLVVKPKAEFTAEGSQMSLYIGETQNTQVTIKNTGSQEAKKLKVRIQPIYPFSSDGAVRYIDSLAPGDEKNLSYSISVDSNGEPGGSQTLGILVDYEDPQGNKLSDSTDFSLSVQSRMFEEKLQALWYLWVILGLIVLILIVRRIRTKKE